MLMAMDETRYKSQTLEHLGLVAAMFDELGIGELVDELIPQDFEQRSITLGQAMKAMVLNGLGFANRRLYLMPEFFENKPTERLLGEGVSPEQINDDALGKALDKLYDFGPSELYSVIASRAARRLQVEPKIGHLDTTSFHVDGRYNSEVEVSETEEAGLIRLTKGYSRDHRDDLNQVVLELIVEHQASLPMLMRPLSGNTSDKLAFEHSIREHVGQLQWAVQAQQPTQQPAGVEMIVTDNAAFTEGCLKAYDRQGLGWVMSVPATVKEAKDRLRGVEAARLGPLTEGYSYTPIRTTYAGVAQRWLLIYSQAARERNQKKVDKQLFERSEKERKAFEKLCREPFHCPEDAHRALSAFQERKLDLLQIQDAGIVSQAHYRGPGRPATDSAPASITHHIRGALAAPVGRREQYLLRRSCFILATNTLDEESLTDVEVLELYKGQSRAERGFRFLKDPMFMASTLYLKKVERVMALLMVMTVCLLVYAALEYRIRNTLREHERASVPDQKGKPTTRPTARWVFEMFEDVHLLTVGAGEVVIEKLVLNLRGELETLLRLLGPSYARLYS